MFDIGFWELLLIAIISLLVAGPEKLPELVRDAGRWLTMRALHHAGKVMSLKQQLGAWMRKRLPNKGSHGWTN